MIVKITFRNKENKEEFAMLFGNSYKKWQLQFEEYYRRHKDKIEILKASKSKSMWIGWGGLKWSSEDKFQEELNREGCQNNEPDNPNPRKYTDMIFTEMPIKEVLKAI